MKLTLILVLLSLSLHFDYVNASSSVQPYDDFSSDARLKASVMQDLHQWDDLSDFGKVSALRHWAAERIDLSSESLFLTNNQSFQFYTGNVSAIFRAFQQNIGGVWCGGTAWTLKRTYQLFGYEAHYLAIGEAGYTTHAETLVYIDDRGKKVLSVQDAYFDLSYVDKKGNPLDYFEMLSLLRDNRDEEIVIVRSADHEFQRDLLIKENETSIWRTGSWLHRPEDFTYLGNSTRLYRVTLDIVLYEKGILAHKKLSFIAQEGHPERLIYLQLYPFQVDYETSYSLAESYADLNILKKALDVSQGLDPESAGIGTTEILLMITVTTTILALSVILYHKLRIRRSSFHFATLKEKLR